MKEDLLKIINHYEVGNQLRKFNEETFELCEAIINAENNKLLGIIRKSCKLAIDHIAEEIADCYVMLEQFKVYYDLDNDRIMQIMKQKINRQLDRIEKENN